MTEINPRCINAREGEKIKGIAYCSNGYILPCCWLDSLDNIEELTSLGLYDEELKLENNESVDQIVTSPQWKNFLNIITTDSTQIPARCKRYCGNG